MNIIGQTDNNYIYNGFGLIIESEMELPEMVLGDKYSNPDIYIKFGGVPRHLNNAEYIDTYYEIGKDCFVFNIPNVAYYLVENGSLITIELYPNNNLNQLRVYLLSTAIGVLLCQRHMVALHSSSIVVGNKSVVICGECGSGKSTISLELKRKGCKMLSDDISAIKVGKDALPYIYPSFPQQKFCADTLLKVTDDLSNAILVDKERNKYTVASVDKFRKEPAVLSTFYELAVGDCEDIKVRQVFGKEKFAALLRNIYARYIIKELGVTHKLLKDCLVIMEKVPFYIVERPKNKNTVNEITNIILEEKVFEVN